VQDTGVRFVRASIYDEGRLAMATGNPKVLVTGSSGPIGAALLPLLESFRYQITRLVRGHPRDANEVSWDPSTPLDPAIVSGYDAVIHLAGESIVGLWTAKKKAKIRESRVQGTTHLANALAQAEQKPKVFISASAIGFYGNRGEDILTENSLSGQGFLPEVSREWESAAQPAEDAGIRVVHPRFGLVLSPKGGALEPTLIPFRLGLGGNLGSGKQWWSWIHVQDVAGAILHAMRGETMRGPMNVVAPNPVRNAEFTKTLARILRRPAFFTIPAFALRLAMGEMADELLLSSQHVRPTKLLASGYQFRFPELRGALAELLH